MANSYDNTINKHTNWNGDETTAGLPVSGRAVQEFIKDTLQKKIGYVHNDVENNLCLGFADEEDYNLYTSNPETYSDLLIQAWHSYQGDVLYGPYSSVEDACEAIPISSRYRGLTVGIISDDSFEEYQWKLGVDDGDLVSKVSKELPELSYYNDIHTIRTELGQDVHLIFKFTSPNYGQCSITISDSSGAIVKQFKTDKGIIDANIGTMSSEGTFLYSVTGMDSFSIPAEQRLEFTVIVGGVKINCDFNNRVEAGLNTSIPLATILNASSADTFKTIKVKGELQNSEGAVVGNPLQIYGSNPSYSISAYTWDIGTIEQWDIYTLHLWAYTGETPDDYSEGNMSNSYEYTFALLNENDFILTSEKEEISSNTNDTVTIPFVIESGNSADLRAHGELYHASENGGEWSVDGDPIEDYTLDRSNIRVNTTNYWALGKISNEGDYIAKMWATTIGNQPSPITHDPVMLHIRIDRYQTDYSIVTEGLIAEFTAQGHSNDNDKDTAGKWTNNVPGNNIYFELNNLNYTTNGWKNVDESLPDGVDGEKMLKFTGESYGVLKNGISNYNPMSNINSLPSGFTAEIIYRTRCIGELNTKVMTCHYGHETNSAGYSASYDYVTIGPSSAQIKYEVSEDEWIHATLVIDKQIHEGDENSPSYDVQDYAPRPLVTVYINGSMCSSFILTDQMKFENIQDLVLLNSAFNTASNKIDFFGTCEIKAIRFYSRALLSSEVVKNYVASFYSDEEKRRIDGRNGDVLPTVKFININNEWPTTPSEDASGVELISFADLNKVSVKALQKKRIVHAYAVYKDPNNDEDDTWAYCVVQTQGTSSLAYPVKNYKITLYKAADMKKKNKIGTFDYLGWQPESKYTLKCDYMEAAHLNNTPSCIFYNNMIDDMVESGDIPTGWTGTPFEEGSTYNYANDKRTPARRGNSGDEEGTWMKYFDAIKGFPCTVTYFESRDEYESGGKGTYVGTYMFNIDKSGDSLGFKTPARLGTDGISTIKISNPRADASLYSEYNSSKTYKEGANVSYDGVAYTAIESDVTGAWDESKWEAIPTTVKNIMQSFEGVANKSNSAGCFYSFEDYKKTAYRDDYCLSAYTLFIEQHPSSTLDLDGFIEQYAGSTQPYATDTQGNPLYLLSAEDYEIPYANEYEYFAADYEARYDWDDLEEGGEEFWGNENWGLKRMIDWVSSASSDITRFRNEFPNYFDLEYCIIYYLQMIVFGQVDNAGKNSMWDTWDGLIWRPRPYDLDTATGLNNSGFEEIKENAELIRSLSPFINNVNAGVGGYADDVAANANARYETYNTRTSKFWIAFATAFKSQISSMYSRLRNNGVYSLSNISDIYIGNTSAIIGESYYNRDMTTKFYKLSGNIEDYISRMHGNRVQKFKSWITKRLIFCDTLFDYTNNTDSLNTMIELRSDAYTSGAPVSVYVSVQTYSPQYVKVDVGSTRDALLESYCAPDSEYIDPNTGTVEKGLLFRLPLVSGNKEIKIYGAGNIRLINNMHGLKASSLVLGGAIKLTSLDVSGSNKLVALSLSNNKYLQSLDCSDCVQLGTDASGAQLDISNCLNLKDVNVDNTKLTSIAFPVGGSLKSVSASNTYITGIRLDSCQFLTNIDVTGCEHILSYEIINCPSLTEINADYLPITSFSISNCANISKISLVGCNSIATGQLRISACPAVSELDFNNNSSPALNTLNLVSINGLTSLNVSGSNSITSIVFSPTIGDEFKVFKLDGSTIKNVSYDVVSDTGIDMSRLTGLTSLSFERCTKVEHIFGLNYVGDCTKLFSNCANLLDIDGVIETTGLASSMFNSCHKLMKISDATLNFANCTKLDSAFAYCYALPLVEIKYMFDSCGDKLTSISNVCYAKASNIYTSASYVTLPAYFFGNLKKVTSADSAFWLSGIGNAIPANAFVDSSNQKGLVELKSASLMFGSNSRITSIPTNILSYMPALTNAARMFGGNSNMVLSIPANFFSYATGLTTIRAMFAGDTKVTVNMNNMSTLLSPLTSLTNAGYLFDGCTGVTGTVPAGFFANNKSLTNIARCFSGTKISGLPETGYSLFRTGTEDESTMNSLTDAAGLFRGCTSLTGTIPSTLMAGATKITTIGSTTESLPGTSNVSSGGMFQDCTGISRFGDDFFNQMPNLTNISYVFSGCTGLIGVPYDSSDPNPNTFPAKILQSHTKLVNVSYAFNNCTSLVINDMPNLFRDSKTKITNVSSLFRGCTNISSFSNDILSGMSSLVDASYVFYGCTSMVVDAGELDLFNGDFKLQNASYAFYNCKNLHGDLQPTLFDDCRSTLTNTSYMFYGCYDSNSGQYNSLTGIASGTEDISDTPQLGLLAECTKLTNTSYMFAECLFLQGRIPYDMFWTSNIEKEYSSLENISYMFYNSGFNLPTEVDGVNYMIHPDFFVKLTRIKDISFMFGKSYAVATSSVYPKWNGSYPIQQNSFYNMYALTTIRGLFKKCSGLGGTITSGWFINSINTITDAQEAFAQTNITSISSEFLRTGNPAKNNKLLYVSHMLYDCNKITGSDIPPMNNTNAYSRIDRSTSAGYMHYCYNCTGATNYSSFDTNTWAASDSY